MTDWDLYYKKTSRIAAITRRISRRKIVGVLRAEVGSSFAEICELGGGNSCFLDAVTRGLNVTRYHVVDSNTLSIDLLKASNQLWTPTVEHANVLDEYKGTDLFDIVFSIGLIEHFDSEGTKRAVNAHFARCRAGGFVLIAFPSPTWLYVLIRSAAERTGKWAFPDERPLSFEEVIEDCRGKGTIAHRSLNWWIGLTQGYVGVRTVT